MKMLISDPNQPLLYASALELLARLIGTPSFSGEENKAADSLQTFLKKRMVTTQRERNNVWAQNRYFDRKKPTVLLNSHIDTVKPNAGYTRDPFDPAIENGMLFGLGSNAGASVVSMIAAFLHLYNRHDLPFNLCLAITAEEETSGPNGITSLLPHLGELNFAIRGKPTGMQLAIAERGNMTLECISGGKTGSPLREDGGNAIYYALQDILWFSSYQFPKVSQSLGNIKMTVTEIRGGVQENVVPPECRFTVDIRLTDAYSIEEVLSIIRARVRCSVGVKDIMLNSSNISHFHPLVLAGLNIGRKITISPPGSEQVCLTIPSVKMGPGIASRSHSSDEFIYLEEMRGGIIIYIKYLEALGQYLLDNLNISAWHRQESPVPETGEI